MHEGNLFERGLQTKMNGFVDEEQLLKVAKEYGSPLYVFDETQVCKRIEKIRALVGENVGICYAMKANPFIVKDIAKSVDRLEVCSPGEYEICIRSGVDLDQIIISGVNKTYQSMSRIIEVSQGKGIYTIESELHEEILENLANKFGVKLKVQIRLTDGSQFGVDEEVFTKLAQKVSDSNYLTLVGIHYFSGTMKQVKKIEKELLMLDEFAARIKELTGTNELELEYGPGLRVAYFVGTSEPSDEEQLESVKRILSDLKNFDKITLEMGRFIAAYCGYYITKVIDAKHNKGKNYCIVDGGIHQINYYGQMLGMNVPYMSLYNSDEDGQYKKNLYTADEKTEAMEEWTVCGSLCTFNDVLVRNLPMQKVEKGSLMIFERCGAYSVTESIALFLSRDLPKVLLYNEEDGLRLVRDQIETNKFNAQ